MAADRLTNAQLINGYIFKLDQIRGERRKDAQDITKWLQTALSAINSDVWEQDREFVRELLRERLEDSLKRLSA